jgi:inorganic pyrophosphatase
MLTKLSTFRGVAPDGEPLVRLFHQGDSISKVAAGYQPEVQDFLSTYTSDKNKIALLVNALGGSEYWGQNVNGDVFPWAPLAHDCRGRNPAEYPFDEFYGKRIPPYGYATFLDAHPFVHHRNKDPSRAFGSVAVSCLNEVMKRVELVVLIDRQLAAMYDAQSFVDRIDAGEFPDVSMGCRVPYDVCTICGHKSKTKDDYCTHVKLIGMNKILDDGRRVGVINLHPRFFDISFVFIGADRTAKVMSKLASGLWVPQSILDAEEVYGMSQDEDGLVKAASVSVPDPIAPGDRMLRMLKKREASRQDSPETVARIDAMVAAELARLGDLPLPLQKARNESSNRQAGYGDGLLRTNAADGVDIQDDHNEKEAAFLEVAGMEKAAALIIERPRMVEEKDLVCPHCDRVFPERGGMYSPGGDLDKLVCNRCGGDIEFPDDPNEPLMSLTSTHDREGVDAGYGKPDDGVTGDPREDSPEGLQKISCRMPDVGGGGCAVPSACGSDVGGSGSGEGQKEDSGVTKEAKPSLDDSFGYKDNKSMGVDALGRLIGSGVGAGLGHFLGNRLSKGSSGARLAGGLAGFAIGDEASRSLLEKHVKDPDWLAEQEKNAAAKKLKAPPHREQYPYHGQYKWNGMTILVENAKETWRVGKGWKTHMKHDYGEIKGSLGSDGDPVDVYVGPHEKAKNIYIIHQNHVMGPKRGQYDEDKVMLGFNNAREAKKAYLSHYDRPGFFRSITEMALPQFKKMIFAGEARGEKIAKEKVKLPEGDLDIDLRNAEKIVGTNLPKEKKEVVEDSKDPEKVAIDLKLEDLFDRPGVRRERLWKDKSTGESTYHVGSGLGKSFSTMQKTAAQMDSELSALFKVSEDKIADVVKDIDPDVTTGRVVEDLTDREECLGKDTLNEAGKAGLGKALATSSMMGMVLKPEEFMRILLSASGKPEVADELDAKGQTFKVDSSVPPEAPCGALDKSQFDKSLMEKLLPRMEGRSYLGPVLRRRVIKISIIPKVEPPPEGVDSPLLSKVGAAYNWYRTEMMKVATHAPGVVSENPALHAAVAGAGNTSIFFDKEASGMIASAMKNPAAARNTVLATAASIPLALMYSASKRRDVQKDMMSGQESGVVAQLIASHPYLTAMGTGALVRHLMQNPEVNRLVGDAVEQIFLSGGAAAKGVGGA